MLGQDCAHWRRVRLKSRHTLFLSTFLTPKLQNSSTINFILVCFTSFVAVSGGWSVWSQWSECSAHCGAGLRHRQRLCNNPPPRLGGPNCQGTSLKKDKCQVKPCSGKHFIFCRVSTSQDFDKKTYCRRTQTSNERPKCQNRLIPCKTRHSPLLSSQNQGQRKG